MPREASTDVAILARLVQPRDKAVLDIGCGGGALVRELAAAGARPLGIEISDEQLAAARDADGGSGARYLVGRAENLPLPDASIDAAVFMRTLHHVPVADMLPALAEARRVVGEGGVVYVAEPLAEGDFFTLTSLVEDEREVRAAAQRALAEAPRAGLARATTVEYEVSITLSDVEAFLRRTASVDPARAAVFEARRAEITAAFADLGVPGERPGERRFVQPMRADLLAAGQR